MSLRRIQRSTALVVLLLSCACSRVEQAGSASASHTSRSTDSPDSATSLRPAASSAPQHPPIPPTTSQSPAGDAEPPVTRPEPPIAYYASWPPCNETRRVVSDGFKTPWGLTPRDVLKIALGTHRTTFTWQRQSSFSYDVEGRSTTLRVEITRRGRATFVKRDGSIRCPSVGPCMGYDCSSSKLLIPVHVAATTQDGAIKAQEDSELTVYVHEIGVSLGQSFATHHGTLRIREIREKGLSVPGFGISLRFTRKRIMVGSIRGSYEIASVGGEFVEYACFPHHPPAELRHAEGEVGCRN
jgi:hypothetical protein